MRTCLFKVTSTRVYVTMWETVKVTKKERLLRCSGWSSLHHSVYVDLVSLIMTRKLVIADLEQANVKGASVTYHIFANYLSDSMINWNKMFERKSCKLVREIITLTGNTTQGKLFLEFKSRYFQFSGKINIRLFSQNTTVFKKYRKYFLKKANVHMCQISVKVKKKKAEDMRMLREWKINSDWKTFSVMFCEPG